MACVCGWRVAAIKSIKVTCAQCGIDIVIDSTKLDAAAKIRGVGTRLKEKFEWLKASSCSSCELAMRAMNLNGPDWCLEHFQWCVATVKANAKKQDGLILKTLLAVSFVADAAISIAVKSAIEETKREMKI